MTKAPIIAALVAVLAAVAAPEAAMAYVGPGAGLTAIGTLLALVGALCLAVVGFVWYPVKRLLRRSDTGTPARETTAEK